MRLIDANEFKKRIDHYPAEIRDIAKKELRYVPTIDAEPIRHGHWEAHDMSIKDVPTEACSRCGEWSYGYYEHYCPKCGALMDEVIYENN